MKPPFADHVREGADHLAEDEEARRSVAIDTEKHRQSEKNEEEHERRPHGKLVELKLSDYFG